MKRVLLTTIISTLILLCCFCFCSFSKKPAAASYKASEEALSILEENNCPELTIEKEFGDYILYPENYKAGFIFYPGGKVECEAYLPLCKTIAEKGFYTILICMPLDLAIFNVNAAEKYISTNNEIANWYIGGHSLGGAMAGTFVSKHPEKIKGIVFMGAFSTSKIDENKEVLSLYGSCDKVLNIKSYNKNRKNLPEDFTEIVIEGGCHSYFGDYGHQDGDGEPTVSREEQIRITVDAIESNLL